MGTPRDPTMRRWVHGSVWGPIDDIPSSLWTTSLLESREELNRICLPLMLAEPWLLSSLTLSIPQSCSSPRYYDGERQKPASWATIPCDRGGHALTHTLSLFLTEGGLSGTELCHQGAEDDRGKVKLFLSPQCVCSWAFRSKDVLEPFHWTSSSLQRYPYLWVIVKIDVPREGAWCRKLLSHRFADVTFFHHTFIYVWGFPYWKAFWKKFKGSLQAKMELGGTSLVVQWLTFLAPNAGAAQVPSLVRELDPTCSN